MDFADKFLDMVIGQKTGALDAREGKKRWVFYFKDGQLVLTKSNIRSEQGAALKETNPDKSAKELIHLQTVMRLTKGSGQLCKHAVLDDAPTKSSNISGNDVFIETYSQFYTVEELEKKCADIVNVKLKLVSDPSFENTQYTAFLNTFEGLLTTATMVARSSLDRKEAWATIWLTWKLGLVEQEAKEAEEDVFDFDLDDNVFFRSPSISHKVRHWSLDDQDFLLHLQVCCLQLHKPSHMCLGNHVGTLRNIFLMKNRPYYSPVWN